MSTFDTVLATLQNAAPARGASVTYEARFLVRLLDKSETTYLMLADGSLVAETHLAPPVPAATVVASMGPVITPPPPVLPPAPTGLVATASDAHVALTWTAVPGATSYTVKRSTTSGSGYTSVGQITGPAFVDASVTNGTTYYYVVTATNAAGEGPSSIQVAAKPAAPVVQPPQPPAVTAAAGDTKVTLTWAPVTNITGLIVGRSLTKGGPYQSIASLPITATSYIDTAVTNGTPYFYVVTAVNSGGSAQSLEVSATPAAVVIPPPPSGMKIGVNAGWNPAWHPATDLFVASTDFTTTKNPWQPQLITELARYTGALRMMDMVGTVQGDSRAWADRTLPTANVAAQTSESRGVAWEWLILLSNLTGRDLWVNIPTFTAVGRNPNDYALQLAKLVQAQLNPGLKVYVEYSNETWNGGPGGGPGINAAGYCISQGGALGLQGNNYEQGFRYNPVASAQVFKAFESVFGANSPRVVKVVAGQRDNAWLFGVHSSQLSAEGQTMNAYGIAPYLDGSSVADLANAIAGSVSETKAVYDVVHAAGLPLLAYEGGQEVFSVGANTVNRDPGMYAVYTNFLNAMAPFYAELCLYLHQSPYNDTNAWGLEEALGQDLATAHKMRATLDWIAAHR